MAEKKITKREKYEMLLSVLDGKVVSAEQKAMLYEHIAHEMELLARKASKGDKPTPAQEDTANIIEIAKDILAECEDEKGMTVGAILKDARMSVYRCHNGDTVSSQKLTSALTKIAPPNGAGDLVREVIKKAPHFRLNYGEVVEGV